MSFPPSFSTSRTLINRPAPHGHTLVGQPPRLISYRDNEALKSALKEALKSSAAAQEVATIIGTTDLQVLAALEEKGKPSKRDLQNFLRLPNNIIKEAAAARGCELIAKNLLLAVIQAQNQELSAITTLFKKGFYGLSSHPQTADRALAVETAELAIKAFFKHFHLLFQEFATATAADLLWKRLEEFLRITIMPLSNAKTREAAAVALLDPTTFMEEFTYRLGQEWAGDHNARFDDNRAKIWGALAGVVLKSLTAGPVHQLYNNEGTTESPLTIAHFMLLPLLENYPAASLPIFARLGLPAPAITGREKSLTRPQLLAMTTRLQQGLPRDGQAETLLADLYQAAASKIFVSPSQAARAAQGFTLGLAACHG